MSKRKNWDSEADEAVSEMHDPSRSVEGSGYRRLCPQHPDVDHRRNWGCPECLRELREERDALLLACKLALACLQDHGAEAEWPTMTRIRELTGQAPPTCPTCGEACVSEAEIQEKACRRCRLDVLLLRR